MVIKGRNGKGARWSLAKGHPARIVRNNHLQTHVGLLGAALQFGESMWQAHELIRRVGTALRTRYDDLIHEPLPERWVDLIHYLDEKERREAQERQRQPY